MPPFQQGQGLDPRDGGAYMLNATGAAFQSSSTVDEDTDCGMSGPSDFYAHSADNEYRQSLPFKTNAPQTSQYRSAAPNNTNFVLPGQLATDENVPVNPFWDRQESWSTVRPARQDSFATETEQQYWQNLLDQDMFSDVDQGALVEPATTAGHPGTIAVESAPQEDTFDATAALFPADSNSIDGFVQHPGLRIPSGGVPSYSPNLDVSLDAGEPSFGTATRNQGGTAPAQQSRFSCTICRKPWKSITEVKKCVARHKKPHLCPHVGCKKKDGFATRNDAERHCISAHEEDLDGNPRPPRPCPWEGCSRSFAQVRNDNLKQHLINVHEMNEKSAKKLIASLASPVNHHRHRTHQLSANPAVGDYSTHQVHEPASSNPSGDGGPPPFYQTNEVGDSRHGHQFQSVHTTMDYGANPGLYSQAPNHSGDFIDPALASSEDFHGSSQVGAAFQSWPQDFIGSSQPVGAQKLSCENAIDGSSFSGISSHHEEQKMQLPCQTSPVSILKTPEKIVEGVLGAIRSRKPRSLSHSMPTLNAPFTPSLQTHHTAPDGNYSSMDAASQNPAQGYDALEAAEIVHALKANGILLEKSPALATGVPSNVSSPAGEPGNTHPPDCEKCIKLQGSRCLLRKHLTREEKPYFCPDDRCHKRCGSKNDIMRHCNSQHLEFNLEKWRCGIQQDGETCGDDFNHASSLQTHLERHHSIRSSDARGLVKKLRIVNQNYPTEFWCGICGGWLGLAGEAEVRRELMFTHFEDHLHARDGEQTGGADDWDPQPQGGPWPVERTLERQTGGRRAGGSFRRTLEPESPSARRQPSDRSSMRPQLSQTSSMVDNKRQLSMSPRLRPQIEAKRLKSDEEVGRKGRERENSGTKSRKGPSFTIKCCRCSDGFGNVMTGVCACGHAYDSCCTKEEVQQLEEEFSTGRDDRQGRGGHRGGFSTYGGFDSRYT